ncbi:hypothetical protein GCM10011346_47410 [Oceanobacillus neutriphilus]|uniref:Protein gp8 n=1 Tax=Oceanobacillus neutriphilus TaxID=531815 RepID=A0ABQ2P235_9BACI|nr:hypothetical protein [Oceanobacillus neutriphilus]GGP16237.1 hypothetical protein GCM10011346_47410 [Oceanobacillus neutriphilus]
MPYLTFEEFKGLTSKDIGDEAFNALLPKASAILDNITNHFYVHVDIEKDNKWRVNKFKDALVAQIEYFHVLGATSYEEINNSPQSFTAGRTSVTNPSRYSSTGQNETKPLAAEDVYIYLEGTGLLNRAVMVW